MDHILRDGTSSETTNVDDIMHIALVDAAVATASPNGTLGVAEVIHVQLLEKTKICVIKQRIDLLLRGRRQNTHGSFTLCSKTALGTMMLSQILSLEKSLSRWKWQPARLPKKKKRIGGSVGFLPIEKLLDHLLHEGNSRKTTNVDIMHTAHVDAAVAEAPLNGPLGSVEVIHVQLLNQAFGNAG